MAGSDHIIHCICPCALHCIYKSSAFMYCALLTVGWSGTMGGGSRPWIEWPLGPHTPSNVCHWGTSGRGNRTAASERGYGGEICRHVPIPHAYKSQSNILSYILPNLQSSLHSVWSEGEYCQECTILAIVLVHCRTSTLYLILTSSKVTKCAAVSNPPPHTHTHTHPHTHTQEREGTVFALVDGQCREWLGMV